MWNGLRILKTGNAGEIASLHPAQVFQQWATLSELSVGKQENEALRREMEYLRGLVAGKKCDRPTILAYFNGLSFDKQLELLAGLAKRLQNTSRSNAPKKGDCDTEGVTQFLLTLDTNGRLEFIMEMIQALKKVPNNNNLNANYAEPTNEELQAELNKLNKLESNTMGGRRRNRKSRKSKKASRRRLTRRHR